MTILPSRGDYPDFGNPQGSQSAAIVDTQVFAAANVTTIGPLDATMFRTLRFLLVSNAGTATTCYMRVSWRPNVQAGVVFASPEVTFLRATPTIAVSLPVMGASFTVTIQANGGLTVGGNLTIEGTVAPEACHLPGPVIVDPVAGLGGGATRTTNAALVVSGKATLMLDSAAAPAAVWCETLNIAGGFDRIASIFIPAGGGPSQALPFQLPPKQTRLVVYNPGGGAVNMGANLHVA